MDDEEDDVFEPDSLHWRTPTRPKALKRETKATQTTSDDLALPTHGTGHTQTTPPRPPGSAPAPCSAMLPCGVPREPRPLFYGNAGFRLHFPARFELPGDQEEEEEARPPRVDREQAQARPRQEEAGPERPVARAVGQKLQLIGDQFLTERLLLHRFNQRNEAAPLWWRLASRMFSLLFEREMEAAAWR